MFVHALPTCPAAAACAEALGPSPPLRPAGVVAGVQGSIQSLFEVTTFTVASIVHQPERFHFLMLGSLGAVTTATITYLAYALKPERRYQLIADSLGAS